jgi:hypothetical protein
MLTATRTTTGRISRSKENYRQIDVFFTDDLLGQPAIEIEVTVVHELLHALTRPWRAQIDSLCGTLSREAYATLADQRVHEEEQLVDRLSRVIVAQAHGSQPYGTLGYDTAKVPSSFAWQRAAPLTVRAPDAEE